MRAPISTESSTIYRIELNPNDFKILIKIVENSPRDASDQPFQAPYAIHEREMRINL